MGKLIQPAAGSSSATLEGFAIKSLLIKSALLQSLVIKSLVILTTATLLTACGGSGGDGKDKFDVTASAGTGGSITPATQSITEDSTATLTVTASSGYSIDKVTGCGGSLSGSTYTTTAITNNCTVIATFTPVTAITVSATAGTGGTITPATQTLASGAMTSATITPNSGYTIDQVTGCGGSLTGSTYTTGAVTSSCAIIATFLPIVPITVSAAASTGGAITPASQNVASGASTTLTLTPDTGYVIDQVSGCGGSRTGNTYTTGTVTSNCAVIATFSPIISMPVITVNAVAGTGGSISPASQTVNSGTSTTLMVTASSGYSIDQVSGCGGSLAGGTYTTAAVTESCAVIATFLPIAPISSITVSAVAGTGGGITPASQTVASGATTTLTVTPNTGYTINQVSGCDGTLDGNTYTTGTITANCAVIATFTPITVTATAGTGGSITPATQNVASGATTTLTVTASNGYNINTVTGCGGALVGDTYTTGPVTTSCSVSATFTRKVTVTATAGGGGSISPGTRSIDQGTNTTFAVTPNAGFVINTVTGCGGNLVGSTYTTAGVFVNCTVNATFLASRTATAAAGANGTVLPATRTVANGATTTFTITPASGYVVDSATGCSGNLSGTTFTTAALNANCTLTVSFRQIPSIFTGGFHTCALNGDTAAKCWGQNSSGQLGVASFSLTAHGDEAGEDPLSNAEVTLPGGGLTYQSLELGTQHSCAILSNNNLYCWGENQNGQLGLGTNSDIKVMSTTPVNFNGQAVVEVSAGGQFTCARLINNQVYCWGLNSSGELGVGDASTRFIPAGPISLGGTPVQLAAGSAHMCARMSNQTVQCWGDNSSGQLGDNDGGNDSATPSSVNLGSPTAITDLASGGLFSCVIVDGQVKCWGENGSGQLGNNDGTNTDLDVPSAALNIGGETPAKLALGGEHGCVLTTLGNVYCWGESDAGQTGQNDTTDDIAPVQVSLGAYTVTDITAGGDHVCVRLLPDDINDTSRPFRCWGEGGVGQLGLEDTSDIGDNEVVDNNAFDLFPWP